ncbi:polymorphic toxin type 50 domain-containing protein [Stutzerimonas nosocomialis]|uniref:polymorphic toxin type 50 domain-containing protein n=1 Tax=Stutzerimonas nosocomialis TaxID=1056496 RepID=UPI00130537E2
MSKPAAGSSVGGTKATTKLPVPSDLPANIHIGQQGKHIRGHNNFIEGRSYFHGKGDRFIFPLTCRSIK